MRSARPRLSAAALCCDLTKPTRSWMSAAGSWSPRTRAQRIGHELRDLLPPAPGVVHLVGGAALARRCGHALALLGVASQSHGEALAARGLYRLAHSRGLPI
jgi:hypothetical protein